MSLAHCSLVILEKREGGREGGRSPFFEEGLTRCGCCSLVSEKAVHDSADLASAVACHIFTFPLFSGHHAFSFLSCESFLLFIFQGISD